MNSIQLMSRYNIKFRLFETNSGMVYQMEEVIGQNKKNFYAFDLSPEFKELQLKTEEKLSNCNSVRQLERQITYENKRYFLFTYLEGETLDIQIKNFIVKKESIRLDKIKVYLTQILETLYQIHKQYILGRVFSTKNIMDCNGQILFLDYGFGPEMLRSNIDLIFPPEIIKKFVEKQSQDFYYDIKIDSWLLGAVLFHLVKVKSINAINLGENKVKIMNFSDIQEYWSYLQQQMERSDHINVQTDRYPKELCQFIQGLLTYNVKNRLSFQQIYNNDFIKTLNLPKYEEYLQFYENYNEKKLNEQIKANEIHASEIVFTEGFKVEPRENRENREPPHQYNTRTQNSNSIPNLNIPSNLVSEHITIPGTSQRLMEDSQVSNQDNIEKSFVFQIQGLSESRFYLIWSYIRMELFRYTFLEKSSEELLVELEKKNFQLEHVLVYFLRKMGYLILVELLKKINQDICPWQCDQQEQQKWKDFLKESQKEILENAIKMKIKELEPKLKDTFIKNCQIYLTEENIEAIIRDQLKADQKCFLNQTIDGISIYNCCSDDFLRNGYRQFILLTQKFLEREKKFNHEPKIKYNTLLLKIIICYLINRIFTLGNAKGTFEGLLIDRKSKDLITPQEIYQYICRDDEAKKQDDILHIWNINFKHE